MPSIATELALIFFLIIANGIFAMTEMAIVSSRKARLEQMADEGIAGARVALRLANEPNHMLSTVQVGITLIGILTGAFGGGTLSRELAKLFKGIPLLAAYSEVISLGLVVALITYVSLIIGELAPKRLALAFPEKIAVFLAGPMSVFAAVSKPVVYFLSFSTQLLLRIFRIKPSDEPPVTEDEIRILISQGTESGVFEESEKDMVDKIFLLDDIRIGALMTPRTQIEWLDMDADDAEILAACLASKHSWLPTAHGKIDEVVGIVNVKELLTQHIAGEALNISALKRELLYIPKNMRALKALETLKSFGAEIALVADEYGGVSGLLSLDDILEQIVGELPTFGEADEPDIVQRDNGSWLMNGMLPIEEFKDFLDVDELPGEDREHFQTLGGFVVSYLGFIPNVLDEIEWNGYKLEVVDMDRTRVDKVLVSRIDSLADEKL